MKGTKAKLLTAFLCLSLIATSVFGLFFTAGNEVRAAAAEPGLRFKQVAAGDGFAIGLTYDSQLYGWSLTRTDAGKNFDVAASTLSAYYPSVPKKIPLNFVKGPSSETYKANGTGAARYNDNDSDYWTRRTDDKVKYIAASATAAAFVSEQGFLYTWGIDTKKDGNNDSLLLRDPDASKDGADGSVPKTKFHPCIIDYNFESNTLFTDKGDGFFRTSYAVNPVSLYAGENNFYLNYASGTPTNYEATTIGTLMWGAYDYGQREGASGASGSNRYELKLGSVDLTGAHVVGGGDTAAFIRDGKIYVKGKNYYLPSTSVTGVKEAQLANAANADNTRLPGSLSNSSDPNDINIEGRVLDLGTRMFDIAGAAGLQTDVLKNNAGTAAFKFNSNLEAQPLIKVGGQFYLVNEGAVHYAPVSDNESNAGISAETMTNSTDFHIGNFGRAETITATKQYEVVELYDAAGEQYRPATASSKARRELFSLSNGFGYVINSGNVYAFGNNAAGQYGSSIKSNGGYTPQIVTLSGDALAVAAGRTRSRYTNQVSASAPQLATISGDTLTVDGQYVDGTEYVSAALTTAGLFVWNNEKAAADIIGKFEAYGVTATGANSIATVVPGYGNELFAISTLGKIFRIRYESGDFKVSMYDRFITDSAADAEVSANYRYRTAASTLHFTESNASSVKDPLARKDGAALAAPQGAVLTLGELAPKLAADVEASYCESSAAAYASMITSNLSGDAFRILLNNEDATGYIDGTAGTVMGSPIDRSGRLIRFYLDSVSDENELLPGGKLDWYLTYKVDVSGSEVKLELYPYRATGQHTILMTYSVGRYDTSTKFAASKTKPVFYDTFDATVNITIANTSAVGNQVSPYLGGDEYDPEALSDSTVPLLDPNYEPNRYYSIAVNDVSTGFAALKSALNPNSSSTAAAFDTALKTAVAGADKGFPAASKKNDTGMKHLFADDYLSRYYTDSYRFFVFDRDGDRIEGQYADVFNASAKKNFDCRDTTVTFDLTLDDTVTSLSGDALAKALDTFNNTYGLILSFNAETNILTVSYHVATVTALLSTNTAQYGDDRNVLKSVTTTDNVAGYGYAARFGFKEFVPGSTTGVTVLDAAGRRDTTELPFHAQASLHTKSGNDPYSDDRITVTRDVIVGEANSKVEFDLSASAANSSEVRFNDYSNLYFSNFYSHDGSSTYEGFPQYAAQFDPDVCEVKLERNKLTYIPKKAETHTFTVVLRRDSRKTAGGNIVPFSGDEEKIYIDFVIQARESTFANSTNVLRADFRSASTLMTVAANKTIRVSEMTDLLNVRLISVNSSDTSKLKVERTDDRQSFTMTPVASGRVMVAYALEQYGESYSGSINVQIESRSTLEETVSIIDKEDIPLSQFRTKIQTDNKETNDIDFGALELDTFDAEERPGEEFKAKGWYFVDPATNAVITANNGLPAFIAGVELTKNAKNIVDAFRVTIGNYNLNENQMPSALFVACFKVTNNSGSVKKFEGAVYVEPKTRYLKDPEVGGDLVMALNVKSDNGTGWTKDSLGNINISLDYLKSLPCLAGLANLDKCKIGLVQTSQKGDEAFVYDYTETTLMITPDLPVSEPVPLNVSISDPASNTSYVLTFYVTVEGIRITLEKSQYTTILFSTMGGVFALLLIIFIIRMSIYWKKKAEQKRIIKKNQMLIRMRDKVHNTSAATTREQIVKTKLKLEDPKYAKMFNEMRKDKEEQTGITLDNSVVAQKVDDKLAAEKGAKKKKKGKKSIEDLKAELEAKKAAFARMQTGEEAMTMEPPIDASVFGQPTFDAGYADGMSREDVENQIKAKMDSGDILFDVEQVDDDNK